MSAGVEFRILGPFEVRKNGQALEIPRGKPRALLAVLLLHPGEVVSVDTLVDELWGERPPPTAAKNVQGYITRLRKALGEGIVITQPPGYAVRVDDDRLDATRFQVLVEASRLEDPGVAAAALRDALALWRGPPLVDFAYESFAQEPIRRLGDLRLTALEDRIEADLALGRHEDVLPELESLVRAHPLRERLQGYLLVALYRCGRQAEALEAYRAARLRLVESLGVEPGPELQRIERRILEHDPSLQAPARRGHARGRARIRNRIPRRGILALAGLAGAALVAALVAVRLFSGADALDAVPNSVAVVDGGDNDLRAVITGGGEPGGIAYGAGGVWIAGTGDDVLLKIDPNRRTVERIPVGHRPTDVAVGAGQVWVVNELDRTVSEINPRAHREVAKIHVGNGASAIAFGHGSVWVANATDYSLSRIDARSGKPVATVPLAGVPGGLAAGHEGIWVTSSSTGQLLLVDPATNEVSLEKSIGNGPQGVTVGGGSIWVANTPDGTVTRFDPRSGRLHKIDVGEAPAGVAYGNGSVWVTNSLSGTVSRIDLESTSVQVVEVGNEPTDVALVGDDAWLTVLPSPASHRGGTLKVTPSFPVPESADPATFGGITLWQGLSLTNDGLVSYRRVGGLAGNELVPDLATDIPQPTEGGRTYTFHLHSGIRYSNGDVVEPADIRRGIERVFELDEPYLESQYAGVLGAERCAERSGRCDLRRGIVADREAGTVTFHLARADPDFLHKLAFAMASATPTRTPGRNIGRKPLPATGPYMTRSFAPGRSWVLVRNPRFREWSHDAQPEGFPDRIVLRSVGGASQHVPAVERGSTDVLLSPPPDRVDELARRYAGQLQSDPLGATFGLVMNTRIAPFDRLSVRRALNYALDRNRIAGFTGSSLTAQPTCQILAPTLPGYRPYCPYTLDPGPSGSWTAPDLAKAEQLVAGSGTRGMKVTLLITPALPNAPTPQIGHYVVSVLRRLGYRASLRTIDGTAVGEELGDSRRRPQIGWFTWFEDSPTPSNFVDLLLSCRSFVRRRPDNLNVAQFCDRGIDAQIRRAQSLERRDPAAAAETWSRTDHELVDRAVWVPLYNPRAVTLLAVRVGNYKYHPFWNVLLDQLWVR